MMADITITMILHIAITGEVYVLLYVCRYRRSQRRLYMPIQGEMGVFQALELQRQTQKETEKGI